ncbi:MAG: tetratricopeptide repeat protein [Phycisphaerae bacterium]|nr:tetratricopeptide repeat protein [Gemmatimonadaceae bacterium]
MSWWNRLLGGASERDEKRPVDFLAEAIELEKRGDYGNALTSYRLALRANPDDLQVLQNMAIAFSRTAQPEEAIRSYRRALQLDPELAGAHYGLAFLLLKRGDTAHAALHLEGFLRNNTGTDAASAKFRAHAEQTLHDLQNMGDTSPQHAADGNGTAPRGEEQGDTAEHPERAHLKHPDQ